MKKFKVDAQLFGKFPEYCVGTVSATGIDNRKFNEEVNKMLSREIKKFLEKNSGENVKELPSVKIYRESFSAMGINPNKFMCSIEALLKRIQKNKELPQINPVVDLGNAFSIKYQIPLGAHDTDKMENDLEIRFSNSNDVFFPMGGIENEKPDDGELIYVSGNTVKTRRWMWRQSEDGKITEKSSNIFFPVDGFKGINEDKVIELRDELAEFLKEKFRCSVKTGFVHKENPFFEM